MTEAHKSRNGQSFKSSRAKWPSPARKEIRSALYSHLLSESHLVFASVWGKTPSPEGVGAIQLHLNSYEFKKIDKIYTKS